MKYKVFAFLITSIISLSAQWTGLGIDMKNQLTIDKNCNIDYTVDKNGIVYSVTVGGEYSPMVCGPVVKRFVNGQWERLPFPRFEIETTDSKIAVDTNGSIYLFLRQNISEQGYIIKLVDGQWEKIWNSTGKVSYFDFVVKDSNNIFISYSNSDNSYQIIVKKWNGINWETMEDNSHGIAVLKVNSNQVPYILVYDNIEHKSFIKYSIDGQWQLFADSLELTTNKFDSTLGMNIDHISRPAQLIIDKNNQIFIVQNDPIQSQTLIRKYESGSWSLVNDTLNSKLEKNANIEFDRSGNIYSLYYDQLSHLKVKYLYNNLWSTLGQDSISFKNSINAKLMFDINNQPIVGYWDFQLGEKAIIKKWNGLGWDVMGTSTISNGVTSMLNFKIDQSNKPIIAYLEDYTGNEVQNNIHVKYFDDVKGWQQLGPFFSKGLPYTIDLQIDHNNTPYVVYTNSNDSSRIVISRFDGKNWVELGNSPGTTYYMPHLTFDRFNNPFLFYISYDPIQKGSNIIIKKFNGSEWVHQGSINRPLMTRFWTCPIVFSPLNEPVIAWIENEKYDSYIYSFKLNNKQWDTLASPIFIKDHNLSNGIYVDLHIDDNGVQYMNYFNGFKTIFCSNIQKKWIGFGEHPSQGILFHKDNFFAISNPFPNNGFIKIEQFDMNSKNWNQIESLSLPTIRCKNIILEFNSLMEPYLGFLSQEAWVYKSSKEIVLTSKENDKLNSGNSIIYPNPFKNILFLNPQYSVYKIELINSFGQTIGIDNLVDKNNLSYNLSNLIEGFHYFKIYTSEGIFVEKVIKSVE